MTDKCAGSNLSQIGFTLIEIMLALAAVVILASIAIPSYQATINKARTGQAIKDIYQIENILERYRSTINTNYPPISPRWVRPFRWIPGVTPTST